MNCTKIIQIQTVLAAALISVVALPASCRADLDEAGFDSYQPGDLHGQQKWLVQQLKGGEWVPAVAHVEVVRDQKTDRQKVEWKAGLEERARLVKRFPPTDTSKALVTMVYTPGNRNVGGRLYFDQAAKTTLSGVAVRFLDGHIYVMEDEMVDKDTKTGVTFDGEKPIHLELRLDFERHQLELLVDHEPVGSYRLPEILTELNQVNFSGGGLEFASSISDLRIVSVDRFAGKPSSSHPESIDRRK